jgi:hypothetical protein
VIEGTGGDGAPYPKISAPGAFQLTVQEQIERQSNRTSPDPPLVESGKAAAKPTDRYGEFLKLDELRQKGILTEEEFQKEKRRLLDDS